MLVMSASHWYLVAMTNVTQILSNIERGDTEAAEKLLPLVYDELRKLATAMLTREKPGQTVQATALVHEAYIRLVDVEQVQHWNSRRHFFAAASEAMRRILVESARRKAQGKRGAGFQRIDLTEADPINSITPEQLVMVDDALGKLESHSAEVAAIFKYRFFMGYSVEEAAELAGVSRATAYRRWTFARAWLLNEIAARD
jgi:RNA polymerase sigma factor (TIGR02999 family)